MTTLQIRLDEHHSVIVQADALTFDARGTYQLTGSDGLMILERLLAVDEENAGFAFGPATVRNPATGELYTPHAMEDYIDTLQQRLLEQAAELAEADQTITELRADLAAERTKLRRALESSNEHGKNIWNGDINSEKNPTDKYYRVSLYLLSDGNIRGTCQCMDWYFKGLGNFNFSYKCKHVASAMSEWRTHGPTEAVV